MGRVTLSRRATGALRVSFGFVVALPLAAQCDLDVLSSGGVRGVSGAVLASAAWDPDGPGPLSQVTVFGGSFAVADDQVVDNLAAFDPATGAWSSIGGGVSVPFGGALDVKAMVVMPNGDLVVGGSFLAAGGTPASHIARWDGQQWHALGGGADRFVRALAVLPNGDLLAGGDFHEIGGVTCEHLARWDGSVWSPCGAGTNGIVFAFAELPNGGVAVGGAFTNAGGLASAGVAGWHPVNGWQAIGGVGGSVFALHNRSNGELVAGGAFHLAAQPAVGCIASWNGASWQAIGGGSEWQVAAIDELPSGDLVIGGTFTVVGGSSASRLARWDGAAWHAFGSGADGDVLHVRATGSGELLVGGWFRIVDGLPSLGVASWDGTTWSSFASGPSGFDGEVRSHVVADNGDLIAGGYFRSVAGVVVNGVARWDGSQWHDLGGGVDGQVEDVALTANGDLLVVGEFTSAGGVAATNIARWNGSQWSPVGSGGSPRAQRVAVRPNGEVIAIFGNVGWRWDGSAWSPTGIVGVPFGEGRTRLAVDANGDVYSGGGLLQGLRRWNGTTSTQVSGIVGRVGDFAWLPDGQLVLAMASPAAVDLVRWDGTTAQPMGDVGTSSTRSIESICVLPDGSLLVAGEDLGPLGGERLIRFDGSTAQPVSAGASDGVVRGLALLHDGTISAVGSFSGMGGVVSASLATLVSTCPATVDDLGAGCTSGAGGTLTADLPWLGAPWQAHGTGLPIDALVVQVFGAGIAPLPLGSVLPQAQAGCSLNVAPELLGLAIATGGEVEASFVPPGTPALVGLTFGHQLVSLELDLSGAIVEATASNTLRMTLGFL